MASQHNNTQHVTCNRSHHLVHFEHLERAVRVCAVVHEPLNALRGHPVSGATHQSSHKYNVNNDVSA